jgi:hypothetical protein
LSGISEVSGEKTSHYTFAEKLNARHFTATKIDLILRPSLYVAAQDMDVFEVWGEEIVFKDVPVEHKP